MNVPAPLQTIRTTCQPARQGRAQETLCQTDGGSEPHHHTNRQHDAANARARCGLLRRGSSVRACDDRERSRQEELLRLCHHRPIDSDHEEGLECKIEGEEAAEEERPLEARPVQLREARGAKAERRRVRISPVFWGRVFSWWRAIQSRESVKESAATHLSCGVRGRSRNPASQLLERSPEMWLGRTGRRVVIRETPHSSQRRNTTVQ